MCRLPLLDPGEPYIACETDLLVDDRARAHWLDAFARQFDVHLEAARGLGYRAGVLEAARREFLGEIERLRAEPARHGRLDILKLDELRDGALRRQGIEDEFRAVKQRENEAALAALGDHLRRVDEAAPADELPLLVRTQLAGNLFDLGAQATTERYLRSTVAIEEALRSVPARPWLIDDLDAANGWWLEHGPRRAVIFADNAGADVVLGVLPMARAMLQRGASVVITANSGASINDITHAELLGLRTRAAVIDPHFASPRLELVASGNAAPLIDLSHVSAELAAAAAGADLVILIGMGRALESNRSARFTCRAWKIAMVKDEAVAESIGGRVYDAVFKAETPKSRKAEI